MAWQGKGMGAAWARHAMCESGFMELLIYHLTASTFLSLLRVNDVGLFVLNHPVYKNK